MNYLLSGNEAIARGAYEAGVTVATGYPGTPSTEILEALVQYRSEVYCEWSPNEKVALEVAVGASLAGARTIVTMKHVGLNVAADPLMTLSYIGTEGGMAICVADDPGMHSSQTEQDTRHYARFAKIPVLEPADSQEALDFLKMGLEISEQHRVPVILRSTTRVSHSRSLVQYTDRILPERPIGFIKDPPRHVPIPVWGRVMRQKVEERLSTLQKAAESSPMNRIEWRNRSLGIITEGIAYQYVREAFPEASILKLGWPYPFPDRLIREFASVVDLILIVEELDNILEEHVRALGMAGKVIDGKNFVPRIGELNPTRLFSVRAKLEGRDEIDESPIAEAKDLPQRPPVLCPGCPHRGIFYALGKQDVIVTGDIGCYSLGVFPPLSRTDTILCMGAGFSMTQGIEKAGEKRKVVGIVGDSTFFHSGITGLLDIVYNRGTATLIVVDNRTTAMTGHQDHPGTGRTLMGNETRSASIEAIGKACGIERVYTVDPYDLENTERILAREIAVSEPSLIVSRAPCPLKERKPLGETLKVDVNVCAYCGQCLDLGCPAMENDGQRITINEFLCNGCAMCQQVCQFEAVQRVGASS